MSRSATFLTGLAGALALGVVAGCSGAPGGKTAAVPPAAAPAAGPYKPTATFQEVMDSIVDPAGDFIWKSVSTTVDAKGVHEQRPQNAKEWLEVRHHAIQLVEAANLLAVPGRKVANGNKTVEEGGDLDVAQIQQRLDTKHDELIGFAGALREVALKLVTAVDQKNVDAITEAGGELDEACEACHKVFWYPDQPNPYNTGDRQRDQQHKQ